MFVDRDTNDPSWFVAKLAERREFGIDLIQPRTD
jgi:hypothetical protein